MWAGVGGRIRHHREALGWSQARLAREICRAAGVPPDRLGRVDVYRWETGRRRPTVWLPFVVRALGVPLYALDASAATLAELVPRSERLGGARGRERGGRRIGEGEVRDLTARVHGLRLADDVLAGGDLLGPAARELDAAVRLHGEASYSEQVGRRLLLAIGELAQIVGWIASDAGQYDRAADIYRLGVSAAREAADGTLTGQLMGTMGYQFSNTGRVRDGVTLAEGALAAAGEDAPPRARALFWDRVAWARAKAGEAGAAVRALGEAAAALDRHGAPGGCPASPAWLYWVDAGELRVMEARCFTELHRPLKAVPLLTEVLAGYDATRARELALYLSWLAVAYADANEPEAAAGTARRVLELAAEIASERTAERARVVLAGLARYVDVPQVGRLLAEYA
jgi:transcriptional regulator with XRE-family HTH domain